MSRSWQMLLAGCGTLGVRVMEALARSAAGRRLRRVVLCDRARVRAGHNALTCPVYAGHDRECKADCLRALVAPAFPRAELRSWPRRVEELRLESVLDPGERTLVMVALDNWQSRLVLVQDARVCAAAHPAMDMIVVQGGIARGEASLALLGCAPGDPCPVCGIGRLPDSEPCAALGPGGELLRGELRAESEAAAVLLAERLVPAWLAAGRDGCWWVNRKLNLREIRGSDDYRLTGHKARRNPRCRGPHDLAALPLAWDGLPGAAAGVAGGAQEVWS